MGVARSGLFAVASVLLFIFLLAGNLFLTLKTSLTYENVEPEVASVVEKLADEFNLTEDVNNKMPTMTTYCQNNSEYVFSQDGRVFVIPCDVVVQGNNAVVDYGIKSIIKDAYYEKYECDFWNCFKENEPPFFLVSEKAKDYWSEKFYFTLLALIILIILMFFLIKEKTNLPIVVGILLALASLPFIKLNWLFSFMPNNPFFEFISVLVSNSYNIFLASIILGLIILTIGIILKFFKIGFKISEFFSKKDATSKEEVKEIVKSEISKSKIPVSKKKSK